MTDLAKALRDFVRLFEQMETPYAVMGGIAVRVYGIPRPTHDIDLGVTASPRRCKIWCNEGLRQPALWSMRPPRARHFFWLRMSRSKEAFDEDHSGNRRTRNRKSVVRLRRPEGERTSGGSREPAHSRG